MNGNFFTASLDYVGEGKSFFLSRWEKCEGSAQEEV
jgi:hypothetical protein